LVSASCLIQASCDHTLLWTFSPAFYFGSSSASTVTRLRLRSHAFSILVYGHTPSTHQTTPGKRWRDSTAAAIGTVGGWALGNKVGIQVRWKEKDEAEKIKYFFSNNLPLQTDQNLHEVHRYHKNTYRVVFHIQIVYYSDEMGHYKARGRSIMDC
jgi:hypothetical protein